MNLRFALSWLPVVLGCTGCSGRSSEPEPSSSSGSPASVTLGGAPSHVGGSTATSVASSQGGVVSSVGGNSSVGVGGVGGVGGETSAALGGTTSSKPSGGTTSTGGASAKGGTSASMGGTTSAKGGATSVTVPGCAYTAPAGSPVATHGQLKVVGTKIVDQFGIPVQLKGVSAFWLNWENPRYAESKSAVTYMRDNWKMMALRAPLGTSASGGYTTSAANKAALQARMDTIIENALATGVYVIIDWHSGSAQDEQGVSIEFFAGMAKKYGMCPNVIYEDFNEPVGVTWAQIKPYHTAIVAAIRGIDPDNLIVLGTPNYSQQVDVAAADPVAGTNLLYTLHFYSCSHAAWLRTKADTAISKGAALFVTEFGATPADGGVSPNNKVCEVETNLWFDWMKKNGISGLAWKLAAGKDSSNYFTTAPPVDGPFPDSSLSQTNGASPGHGQFIVDWLRK